MDDDRERNPSAADDLRRRAEEQLQAKGAGMPLPRAEAEAQRLLHELQVHQIELEMQNEELRQARDEVEMALEKYSDLYDFAPVGYATLDREGTIRAANLTCAALLTLDRSHLIGRRLATFIAPADRPAFNALLEGIFSTPAGNTCEVALAAEGAAPRFVQLEGAAASGQECRLALIDITELRRARRERQKTQELESLGLLAGGIAHDFNNLLTVFLGNVSVALVQVHEPAKVARRLRDAETAALRAKDLTQKLLVFASGGGAIRKVIQVNDLVKGATAFAILGSTVQCEMTLADDLWPVLADEGQLRQVIHNLVLNAVQAVPEGGKVTIVAGNAEGLPEGQRAVEISVADNGPGIPPELLARVFDPYFTTRPAASGLGLAVCHSIVKQHGGEIALDSRPGQGTRVGVSLPGLPAVQVVEPEGSLELFPGADRVLIMDDEDLVRAMLKVSLEELGYLVEGAEHGGEAVDLYRRRQAEGTPFAAVILDLTVPGGMGGKEAMAALLKVDPKVKAIVSSGYCADPVLTNYREFGFSRMLAKPYRIQELSRVLHEMLATDH